MRHASRVLKRLKNIGIGKFHKNSNALKKSEANVNLVLRTFADKVYEVHSNLF